MTFLPKKAYHRLARNRSLLTESCRITTHKTTVSNVKIISLSDEVLKFDLCDFPPVSQRKNGKYTSPI